MSEPSPGMAAAGNQPIAEDLPCLQCGYNLRTLQPSGVCPECGTLVLKSLEGNMLRYADPKWLARVRSGASMTAWSLLLIGIGYGFSILMALALEAYTSSSASGRSGPDGLVYLPTCIISICFIILLVGIIRLSLREPNPRLPEGTISHRKMVNYCVLSGFAGFFVLATGLMLQTPLLLILGGILLLFAYFTPIALFGLARQFFLRVPDFSLARQCRIVVWGWLITYSLTFFGSILAIMNLGKKVSANTVSTGVVGTPPSTMPVIVTTSSYGPDFVMILLSLLFMLAGLFFSIWALVLLFRLRAVLHQACQQSQAYYEQNNTGPARKMPDMTI